MNTECRLSWASPPSNVIADTAADARPTSPTSYRRAPTIQNSIPNAALATVENINATAFRATSTAVCTLAVTPASYVRHPAQALGPAWAGFPLIGLASLSMAAQEPSGQSRLRDSTCRQPPAVRSHTMSRVHHLHTPSSSATTPPSLVGTAAGRGGRALRRPPYRERTGRAARASTGVPHGR